jgi:serine/threonine protein kinase
MKDILLTYANNKKAYLPKLEHEINAIDKSLDKLSNIRTKLARLTSGKDISDLLDRFNSDLSIFLFSGHASPEGVDVENGNTILGDALAGALNIGRCPNLKIVFLNGCSTSGMVNALLKNGVPVVIYTCNPVDDNVAANFSISIFNTLSTGGTIEQAFRIAQSNSEINHNIKVELIDEAKEARLAGYLPTVKRKIDKNKWGCIYINEIVFKTWKIATENDENILQDDFNGKVQTETDTAAYKRLIMLRKFLVELEKNKELLKSEKEQNNNPKKPNYEEQNKNIEGQIRDIESLCLHIENEIKTIKLIDKIGDDAILQTSNSDIKYRLTDIIAFGRFSDIYKAIRHVKDKKESVAFKVLKDGAKINAQKIRNTKEFEHDNLVKTIAESFGGSLEYYVTEFISKTNLRDFIVDSKVDNKKNELANLKLIIGQVCDAIHYLHEQNYSHMDIRPSNIVIKTKGNAINRVLLIDLDDHRQGKYDIVVDNSFKSNPYLDPIIRDRASGQDFSLENFLQADMYALTLVVLFCIVKVDLMEQSMVKKLLQENGLKDYIDSLDITDKVKSFLKKGTGNNGDRFKSISEFKSAFEKIKRIKPYVSKEWSQKYFIKLLALLAIVLTGAFGWYFYQNAVLTQLNTKFEQFQDWHLPKDTINGQIPYVYNENNDTIFIKNIKIIVDSIVKFSKKSDTSVHSLVNYRNFDETVQANVLTTKFYRGVEDDRSTKYYPEYSSIDVTIASKDTINLTNFNPSANSIINKLSNHLKSIFDNNNKTWKNGEQNENIYFLDKALVGRKDSNHIITLFILGYIGGHDSTSFMFRYPAYKFVDRQEIYKLPERPWWKDAKKKYTQTQPYGFTHPYIDTRKNMPQPRTFWYLIPLNNNDTAVLGIDFIFKPIKD